MEGRAADAIVNRDEPAPALTMSSVNAPSATSFDDEHAESKRSRLKEKLSGSKLTQKLHEAGKHRHTGDSLQDRLLSKLMQQVIPQEDVGDEDAPLDERSSKYVQRPSFSLPLMTNNFRRFNARIGVVFVLQTRLIRLLNWSTTSHTLSLLAILTFVCLDPYLLPILPLASSLIFLLVPAFLARHPLPPSPTASSYSLQGPPLAPARTIRPASEMSKDFFRNMRDLQNSMDDFSTAHDALIAGVTPSTNFSNESLSSSIFLILFVATCLLFITSHLLPWRFLALTAIWTIIPFGHPAIQQFALAIRVSHIRPHEKTAQSFYNTRIATDISLDSPPEQREVEIFELQHLHRGEWEPWVFTPAPYDPLSPSRIAGERVKGTRFFEDVQAPQGWEWSGKKWELDLESKDWVAGRACQGVGVEQEGERWVVDLAFDGIQEDGVDSLWEKAKKKSPDWEEDMTMEKTGEWRRRRWVRMVKRRAVQGPSFNGNLR